jgi:sigma-B regulation protein RsbU (phosphoserine phosphatase)
MITSSQRFERLRRNVLIESLTDEQFATLRPKLTERRHASGGVILEDQTNGDEVHLIVEGRVRITKRTRHGRETLLALLHPGDFFGELEVIDHRPRAARVTAIDDCVTYTISTVTFEKLLHEHEDIAYRLLQVLSVRLRTADNHFMQEIDKYADHAGKELQRLQRLIEAAKVLNSTLDLDKLLGVILETALGLVEGDRGTVYVVEQEKQELWSRVLKGDRRINIRLPMGSGIAGYVAATGDTLNIADAYLDPRFNPEIDRQTGYRTRSILCMPMKNRDGITVGVFQLLNKQGGPFTRDDETVLGALSVHAAIALENARLHEQERVKIAMEKDLLAAREVQMMLIPKRLPEVPGYEFAACTIPAREVGGDLYDFAQCDHEHLSVSLGDVSGKGLAASLLMANVQAILREQATITLSPAACLKRTNALLFENTSVEKFVTLFYAVLDPASGVLRYSNAGHEQPFLFRANGTFERLSAGGIVLGILEDFPFEEEQVSFERGDVLIIFSDGVSEAVNQNNEQFGQAGIEDTIRNHALTSATELRDLLVEALRKHAGSSPQADDITVVIIRRNH